MGLSENFRPVAVLDAVAETIAAIAASFRSSREVLLQYRGLSASRIVVPSELKRTLILTSFAAFQVRMFFWRNSPLHLDEPLPRKTEISRRRSLDAKASPYIFRRSFSEFRSRLPSSCRSVNAQSLTWSLLSTCTGYVTVTT